MGGGVLKASGVDLLRIMVWGAASLVLTYVGLRTADSIDDLGHVVSELQTTVKTLEFKVEGLPPADLILRIEILEEKQQWDDNHHRIGHNGP